MVQGVWRNGCGALNADKPGLFALFVPQKHRGGCGSGVVLSIGLCQELKSRRMQRSRGCRLQQRTATRGTVGVDGRGWMADEEKEERRKGEQGKKKAEIGHDTATVTKCEQAMADGDLSQKNDPMRRGV